MISLILSLVLLGQIDAVDGTASTNGTSNSEDPINNYDKELLTTATAIVAALIGASATIYVGFNQYKKTKELQSAQHYDTLEYDYNVKLRDQRIKVYPCLWSLTHIGFDVNSNDYEFLDRAQALTNWYFEDGNGMLLTEPSQKLWHNFKNSVRDMQNNWNFLYPEERESQIDIIKKTASGLRTSLLRDVGTRGELKNLPSYDMIIIKKIHTRVDSENQEYHILKRVDYKCAIKEPIKLKNNQIVLQITDLDVNRIVGQVTQKIMFPLDSEFRTRWISIPQNPPIRLKKKSILLGSLLMR